MERTETTCPRHPGVTTRLACSACGTPICPRCAVTTPVGMKCPDCARLPRSARAGGRPDQYAKAVAFGAGAAVLAGLALMLLFGTVGVFRWIASAIAGYAIANAVIRGSGGNRADGFRWLAVGLTVVAVAGAWLLAAGTLTVGGLGVVTYLAGGYGAFLRFGR